MKTSKVDRMSMGKKREIADMYANPKVSVKTILETYGINHSQLYKITEEFNIPYRDEKKRGRRSGYKLNKCPNCHKGISIMEAKFCPFCGTDIQSEEDLLLEDLSSLWCNITPVIGSYNDEARRIILKVEKYIKSKNPRLTRFNQ